MRLSPLSRIPSVPVEMPDARECSLSNLGVQFGDVPIGAVEVPKKSKDWSKPLERAASISQKFRRVPRKEWRGEVF